MMAWGAVDDSPQALGTITTCACQGDGRLTAWWAKDPRSRSLLLAKTFGVRSSDFKYDSLFLSRIVSGL